RRFVVRGGSWCAAVRGARRFVVRGGSWCAAVGGVRRFAHPSAEANHSSARAAPFALTPAPARAREARARDLDQ
ncbi:MAG TPA: hypothetical protein VLT45_11680, partial [Kofleriaceae bacterium]|nr:hypothetical protein [Kofleriaceae bacterium]